MIEFGEQVLMGSTSWLSGAVAPNSCLDPSEFGDDMTKILDITGQRFGKLTAIKLDHVRNQQACWLFKCDCGNFKIARATNVKCGSIKSCGCARKDRVPARLKHGYAYRGKITKEYRTWTGIISRCYNKNEKNYKYYGERGIKMCEEWRKSFESFYKDMGDAPTPDHSIDRIDNDKNYEPSNCRWVTGREQRRNTTRTVWLTYNGRTMIQSDWARELNVNPVKIYELRMEGLTFTEIYHKLTKERKS